MSGLGMLGTGIRQPTRLQLLRRMCAKCALRFNRLSQPAAVTLRVRPQLFPKQQAGYGGIYGGSFGGATSYDASVSAALAAQQAAAMHQMAYGTSHHPATYGGMPAGQSPGGYYSTHAAMQGVPPPPPRGYR